MDAILTMRHPAMSASPRDLVAEANHRIANSLTLLVSMVRMQAAQVRRHSGPLPPADVRLMLEGIAARINTISQLHRLLSHVDADGVANLRPHLKDVTDALVAALSSPEQAVRVTHSGNDCMVMMHHMQPIILILCEIFINAMKYAHPAGVTLLMTVDCRAGGDGRLVLSVSDDGVGLPEDFDVAHGGGLGFKVMRGLAAEIGADFTIHSSNLGLSFRLSLPEASMASDKLA
jgi:two-component sensor histidine kinase